MKNNRGFLVCVVPFVAYLLLTVGASKTGDYYPLTYGLAVLAVGSILVVLLPRQTIFKPHIRVIPGIVVGTIGILIWIGLSHLRLEEALAPYLPSWLAPTVRVGFNPFEEISSPPLIGLFVGARLLGLVVLVPLAEELFWRGFLARWLIEEDWMHVPIGKFTPWSFAIVTLMFTLAHPEWFAAAAYCALLNAFLCRTKDLWNCIVAHAVSNLLLAAYVMATGEWWLW